MASFLCAGCGHANAVGDRFCAQCGSSLAPRCAACGAELALDARFCSACGVAVEADPVGISDGTLKVVSVVFSDLVGSTALQGALDTESVRRVMGRFYEAMAAVVERHGGAIQKFIGDAVVVVFGMPVVREDDALRAVRCAAAMVDGVEVLNEELERAFGVRLQVRTGVNTGELVVNDDGIFVGDTMNTAARFEQAAGAGEVLLGAATRRMVREQVELEELEPLALKGKSDPVRAWRVVSVTSGSATRLEAPLVGRASELDRLRGALGDAIAARACRLVSVVGSPGLGKSRLAAEFARAAHGEATVVQGHCEPSGEGITFLPVAELLRGVAGIDEADDSETVVAKLSAIVGVAADRDRVVVPAAGLLGAGTPAVPEETFWSVRRLLEAAAQSRPLVVVLDDVHWGQPMFLDLVEHLVEWVRDAPILLVALARPELRDVREALATAGRRPAAVIELAPLDSGESRRLVGGLLGGVEPPPVLVERMLATTEGNPLFLGELLRMLVDEGTLTRSGDGWVAAGGADAVQVPPTIQALLTARIERLRADERAVVERAAVIGQLFYRGAVAQLVAPLIRSGLDGHLETLRRKDMVEPDGTYWLDEPVYRFHHVLLRDAAYHLLLKEARAELHEKFADWLATKAGELVGEHEEVIAYHLEQAHEYRRQLGPLDERSRAIGARAAALLASAGRRALQREDLPAAANLLARALERGADESASWELAEALLSAGDTAGAAEVVKALAGPRGVVMATQLAMLTGSGADLEAVIAATGELAGAGDGAGAAKGHHVTAQVQAQLGRVADVESSLDKALLAARKAEDRRRITAVLAAAPRAALWGPSPVVRASGRCLDVVRILRMTPGNRHVEAVALRCQAVLEAMRGRADAARDILAAGRTTLEELGLTLELHELDVHAGLVELLAGEPAAASVLLATARDGFAALGVSVSAAQAAALTGRALVEQGRFDEALAETEFAQEHAGGDLKTTITWLGVRAEALARRGGLDEALELSGRAVELAEPTDALADKADAQMALARVLREAARADESRSAAEAARTLYAAKDHVVGAARADQLLEAASAPALTASGPLAPRATVPDPELARFFARYSERVEARDLDGLVSLYAPDYVLFDHRPVGWGERRGHAKAREQMESVFAASPDLRFCIDELLDCAPGVVAMRTVWRGSSTETGGTLEVPLGYVATIVEGRLARLELFEPDAETSVRACFADLRGRTLLGDRPPERWWAEFVELLGQHDRSGLAHMWSPDMVLVDHRSVGWEKMHGLDAMLELADSAWSMAPDVRASIEEVIACDERTIAILLTYVGSAADGGGLLEIPVGYVSVYSGGVGIRGEQFGPDDCEAMLTRFAELGGTTATLGDRPPQRLLARHVRRFNAHDVAGVCALVSDDVVYADHRAVAPGGAEGREAYERVGSSLFEIAPDVRVEVNDVLACDERVIVVRTTYSGQGADEAIAAYERSNCEVWLLGADGLFARTDHYDDDDPQGALARYAELGGGQSLLGDRPSERWWARVLCAYARGDVEALVDLYAEDWAYTDHRQLGWETMRGQSEVREFWRSALSVSTAQYGEIDEVLACDDRVIAVAVTWRGIAADTGGAFALPVGNVSVIEAGHSVSQEQFDPGDRDALLARYAELGGPGQR